MTNLYAQQHVFWNDELFRQCKSNCSFDTYIDKQCCFAQKFECHPLTWKDDINGIKMNFTSEISGKWIDINIQNNSTKWMNLGEYYEWNKLITLRVEGKYSTLRNHPTIQKKYSLAISTSCSTGYNAYINIFSYVNFLTLYS